MDYFDTLGDAYIPDEGGWVAEEQHVKALETIDELRSLLSKANKAMTQATENVTNSMFHMNSIKSEIYNILDETTEFTND